MFVQSKSVQSSVQNKNEFCQKSKCSEHPKTAGNILAPLKNELPFS